LSTSSEWKYQDRPIHSLFINWDTKPKTFVLFPLLFSAYCARDKLGLSSERTWTRRIHTGPDHCYFFSGDLKGNGNGKVTFSLKKVKSATFGKSFYTNQTM